MVALLDTNVLIYHLTKVDREKAERSLRLLRALEERQVELAMSELVVAETVWILESRTRLTPEQIRDALLPITQLPSLRIPNKQLWPHVFDLYCERRIDFVDAYNAAWMERQGMRQVYSYDKDFDRIEGIERITP
ncbi:MAG: PIN domain-containing protein [Dehalococcoidia bacterium]|nr:PIN domain-containing protein [Dehalococcoidia bacterium]